MYIDYRAIGKFIVVFAFCLTLMTGSAIAGNTEFTDTEGHWAEETIEWGIETDMVKGYPDGTFRPDREVTEAEFLTLMLRAYDAENGNEEYDHWADSSYEIAEEYNVKVEGINSIDKRNMHIDRTSVAEQVSGAQGAHYDGRDAILYMLKEGLAGGRVPGNITIRNYQGDELLTRAESVQFIRNVIDKGVDEIKERPFDPSEELPDYGDDDVIGEEPNGEDPDRPVLELDDRGRPVNEEESFAYLYKVADTIERNKEDNTFSYYLPPAPEGLEWNVDGLAFYKEGDPPWEDISFGRETDEGDKHYTWTIEWDNICNEYGSSNFRIRLVTDNLGWRDMLIYSLETGEVRKSTRR